MRSTSMRVRRAPEDRGADAHQRRAFGDRGLEVGRHPHRQRVDRQARGPARRRSSRRRIRNWRAPRRHRRRRLGDAHEAAQPQAAAARRRAVASATASSGRDAALRRFAADVDLHADVERRQLRPGARRQPLARSSPGRPSAPRRSARRPPPPCCSAAARSGAIRGRQGRRARPSSPAPPARSSRRTHAGPSAWTARIASGGNVLLTASSRTIPAVAPGRRAPPVRCAPARLATPSRSGT